MNNIISFPVIAAMFDLMKPLFEKRLCDLSQLRETKLEQEIRILSQEFHL